MTLNSGCGILEQLHLMDEYIIAWQSAAVNRSLLDETNIYTNVTHLKTQLHIVGLRNIAPALRLYLPHLLIL